MSQAEVIALVQELGGKPEHIARLRDILSRIPSRADQTLVLSELSPPAAQTLPAQEIYTSESQTVVGQVQPAETQRPVGSIPRATKTWARSGRVEWARSAACATAIWGAPRP